MGKISEKARYNPKEPRSTHAKLFGRIPWLATCCRCSWYFPSTGPEIKVVGGYL